MRLTALPNRANTGQPRQPTRPSETRPSGSVRIKLSAPTPPTKAAHPPAFSRFDLLLAAAILILLTAILLPSLSKARARARRSTCLTNTAKLQQSLQNYTTQWNTLLPFALDAPALDHNFWLRPLGSLQQNAEKIRQCPEATAPNARIFSAGTAASPWNQPDPARGLQQSGAYTINGWLYQGHFATSLLMGDEAAWLDPDSRPPGSPPLPTVIDPDSFYRLPQIKKPEAVPTFADAIWSETFPAPDDPMPANLETGAGPDICFHLGQIAIARHGAAVNVAFFDGHAETIPLDHLWTLNWQSQWPSPAPQ